MMISIMRPYDFEYNTGDNEDGLSIWSYMSTCVKLPSKLWSKSSTVSLKNISQILVIMIVLHMQEEEDDDIYNDDNADDNYDIVKPVV